MKKMKKNMTNVPYKSIVRRTKIRDVFINVLSFVLVYLVLVPILLLFVNYWFYGVMDEYVLAKSIGQTIGFAVAQLMIYAVSAGWKRLIRHHSD